MPRLWPANGIKSSSSSSKSSGRHQQHVLLQPPPDTHPPPVDLIEDDPQNPIQPYPRQHQHPLASLTSTHSSIPSASVTTATTNNTNTLVTPTPSTASPTPSPPISLSTSRQPLSSQHQSQPTSSQPPSSIPLPSSVPSPPPPPPPPAPPEKRPRRVELIVKLGGSALTDKSVRHALHTRRFTDAIDTVVRLHTSGVGLIVVHGAGSFGHFEAREHSVSSGAASPLGMSATHASVTALNLRVVHALIARGIPAVGVSPLLVPARTRIDFIAALLDRGHLPVLHGDTCYAGDGRTAIISGDALVISLAAAFPFVNRVVFLSDVPGLLRTPPSKKVPSIHPDSSALISDVVHRVVVNEAGELRLDDSAVSKRREHTSTTATTNNTTTFETTNTNGAPANAKLNTDILAHDTTGGMAAKVMAAAKCAAESSGRVTSFIAQVGSQAADVALLNRPDRAVTHACTRICFEPDGVIPPMHVDDPTAAQNQHISFSTTDPGKKGNRGASSLTRPTLPRRGSGLSERSRRRGWFT